MNIRSLLRKGNAYKAIVFLGVMGTLYAIVMGWGGMFFLIRRGISKVARLVPGTETWEKWKTIPVPVYLKLYVFNISNAEDLTKGERAIVNEMGPYTYLIDFDKHNFVHNEENDTYFYQPSKTYYFQPEMSNGSEDDLITFINILFVGVSHVAHAFTDIDFLLEQLDQRLAGEGEKLYRTDTVKGLFFNGIKIQPYINLFNDPLVQQAGNLKMPEDFEDGKFGLFKGKNGTINSWWEVRSGVNDYRQFGQVASYQNKTKLDKHKHDNCNAINGSDGTLNPPFSKPGVTDLYIFVPELCRSLKWQYDYDSVNQGIPVSRYHFPEIETPNENPDLWCFCPYEDLEKCNIHGLATLAPCFSGVPIMYSKPHFLDVDSTATNISDGLSPDDGRHRGFIDLHSMTGATVEASVTMQLSIELMNWEAMPSFANASRAYVPLAWFEQVANMDDVTKKRISRLTKFMELWLSLRWVILLCFLGLTGIGGFLVYSDTKAKRAIVFDTNKDKDKTLKIDVKQ